MNVLGRILIIHNNNNRGARVQKPDIRIAAAF